MGTLGTLTRRELLAGAGYLLSSALLPPTAEAEHLRYCNSHWCGQIVKHEQSDFKSEISELERKLQNTSVVKPFVGE